VRALRAEVGEPAAADVHRGGHEPGHRRQRDDARRPARAGRLLDDLGGASDAAARLAGEHRATVMAGRTLLQQAVPITFGLKAAGWLVGLDEGAQRLDAVRRSRLAAQLGGAAGTLAAQGDAGIDVLSRFARELGLAEPVLPWHTTRTRIAELATALGMASGAMAKVAGDVVLLAQTEVGEVREGGGGERGGSSAMPHKHNPVAAISALAGARQAPGLVANLLAAMEHEHERAAGAWHAEWGPLRELLRRPARPPPGCATASSTSRSTPSGCARTSTARCWPSASPAPSADPTPATACARRSPPGARLADIAREHLSAEEADRVLDPATYLGATDQLIDRALSAHNPSLMTAIDVSYEIAGPDDAPVLVLSNSLGSTGVMWDPQVPRLAERLRVVRYDHRGHGGSPVPPGPYSLDDLGADALALLDRLGLERVTGAASRWAGWSGCGWPSTRPSASTGSCCAARRRGWGRRRCGPIAPRRCVPRRRGHRRRRHRALADRGLHRARATEDRRGARHAGGHPRRGLRRLLRGHRAHGPHPAAGCHRRADPRHRRPP
jgi:hypothetical protein